MKLDYITERLAAPRRCRWCGQRISHGFYCCRAHAGYGAIYASREDKRLADEARDALRAILQRGRSTREGT